MRDRFDHTLERKLDTKPDSTVVVAQGPGVVTGPGRRQGRRPGLVYPPNDERRQKHVEWSLSDGTLTPSKDYAPAYELALVNLLRQRVKAWRKEDYPGVTRTR